MPNELTYKNNPIDVKLSFNTRFKLISMGLNIASLLITDGASIVDFCKAWSIILNEPFNEKSEQIETETENFLKGFSMLEAVNPYVLFLLKRDGIFEDSETSEESDESKKKLC